ncbi:MAG: ABC transporter ATP-binding protein [Myxococcota bacterium]
MTPLVALTDVRRSFGAVEALRGLTLRVGEGEIVGLLGPDGAGKTTAIRCIAGLLDVDSGSVALFGGSPDAPGAREQIGVMPQRFSLYGDLSIAENLDFFRKLFLLSPAAAKPRMDRLLDITRLGPFLDRRADDLSGGMYKKLALACALLHQPRLLLLDEPTNGVDPVSRRELWDLLGEFVSDGMGVLVSTPYMDEAERCHRVGLLHEGRLLVEGSPRALVDGLEHPVWMVRSPRLADLRALVDTHPAVVASSPAGERVRVVVDPTREQAFRDALAPLDPEIRPMRPDFEDVFLARVSA